MIGAEHGLKVIRIEESEIAILMEWNFPNYFYVYIIMTMNMSTTETFDHRICQFPWHAYTAHTDCANV